MSVRIITEPKIVLLAQTKLEESGLHSMARIVEEYHPECGPDPALFAGSAEESDAELLPELAGRTCYYSFGTKRGQTSNAAYIVNLVNHGHMSCLYHTKFTWFIFGLSRRVGEEFLRHYVGAERDREGSPSKESTRYTEHGGLYVSQPGNVSLNGMVTPGFVQACEENAAAYRKALNSMLDIYVDTHGTQPKGLDRKRIYENAAGRLNLQTAASFVWTGNPVSIAKLINERSAGDTVDPNHPADLEFQRFAVAWRAICLENWPNLFGPLLRKRGEVMRD